MRLAVALACGIALAGCTTVNDEKVDAHVPAPSHDPVTVARSEGTPPVDDASDHRPLTLSFVDDGDGITWIGQDLCNDTTGPLGIGPRGRVSIGKTSTTLVACGRIPRLVELNANVLRATAVMRITGHRLLLYDDDGLFGIYQRTTSRF